MSKSKILINRILGESVGMDTTGLAKQIVKKDSPISNEIVKFFKSKFKKTKIHLLNAVGEIWEINCECPIDVTDTMTGIEKREIAKQVAYEQKNELEKFIADKFNFTPLSIGGIDAQGNTCKFLIQFVMRNLNPKELVEGLLREEIASNVGYIIVTSDLKYVVDENSRKLIPLKKGDDLTKYIRDDNEISTKMSIKIFEDKLKTNLIAIKVNYNYNQQREWDGKVIKKISESLIKEAMVKFSTSDEEKTVKYPFRLFSKDIDLRKFTNLVKLPRSVNPMQFDKDELGFESKADRKEVMNFITKVFKENKYKIEEFKQ